MINTNNVMNKSMFRTEVLKQECSPVISDRLSFIGPSSSFILSSSSFGFTLIEVLISLTLMTVVLGAVYSSFFSVHRALERFDTVSLKYHEARTALDMLRREIESAFLKNPRDVDAKASTIFEIKDRDIFGKNASSLKLTSFSYTGSNLYAVSYFVKEKDGRLDLLKAVNPPVINAQEYTLEIIESIESFTVETLFNNKWVKTWNTVNTGMLPEVVKVSIEFDDNGKIVKLSEYARPRIGMRL
jgi:general secretion pathway protein J